MNRDYPIYNSGGQSNLMFKNIFTFKSILSRLLGSYILLILIPVIILGSLTFTFSEKIINKKVIASENNTIVQIGKNVDVMIDQIIAIINIYNLNSNLKSQLKANIKNYYARIRQQDLVENEMLNYSYAFDWLRQDSILLGANGRFYSNNHISNTINLNNISKYTWFKEIMKEQERITWSKTQKSFFKDQEDINTFIAAKVLKNETSNEFCGILFFCVNENNLYNIYKDSLSAANQIFISDSQGNIISSSIRGQIGQTIDLTKYIDGASDGDQGNQLISLNHKKYFCIFKRIAKTGWYIIEATPLSSISKDIDSLRTAILITCLFCLLICIMVSIIMSKKITMPLLDLSRKVKNYRSGHLSPNYSNTVSDEIASLNIEYDNIIKELDETIHKLIKEQNEKRKTELQALQMQIGPHFLYNTINSIKCLIWAGKTALIEPMVDALVNLLEHTINRNEELIPLEEELDLIRNYICIHEIRTGNTILLNLELDDDLKKSKIPKLLLQPIIENAIFHGIEPKGSAGTISISCSYCQTDNDIKIEILDNGVGMSRKQMDEILTTDGNQQKKRFSGIGVKNVDERLKLYFGPNYGLKINSSEGIGTSIIITLPRLL
jgi:two-component system sensor histidine kinase YesM